VERTLPTSRSPLWIVRPPQLTVGMTAEMQPRNCLLPGVTSLRIRHPSDLIVAHLLWESTLVDLRTEGGPAAEDPGGVEVSLIARQRPGRY
jgi:hypothetical protein